MKYKHITYEEANKLKFFYVYYCTFCWKSLNNRLINYYILLNEREPIINRSYLGFCDESCANLWILKTEMN